MTLLKQYGIPLGAVALCGAGAFYLAKRMNDLESRVSAMKRSEVRHLSETDVRMIVAQMQRERQAQPVSQPAAVPRATAWSPKNKIG